MRPLTKRRLGADPWPFRSAGCRAATPDRDAPNGRRPRPRLSRASAVASRSCRTSRAPCAAPTTTARSSTSDVVQTSAERLAADQVLEVVRVAIATVLEIDPAGIDRSTMLADLGADSLALVVLAEVIEEHVRPYAPPGHRLGDRELAELRTVGDTVDLVTASL